MTKRNSCSPRLNCFTTILLSLTVCWSITSIFPFLHLFEASGSFSTKKCLSSSKSWKFAEWHTWSSAESVLFAIIYLLTQPKRWSVLSSCQESIPVTLFWPESPKYVWDRLKQIQNNAARIVFKALKHYHVSSLLHSLHWLPITKRIDYKLCSLCFSVINGTPRIPVRTGGYLHPFSTASLCFIY